MSGTKVDQLPAETLMKIFRYIPNHKHVSLVNKRFYHAACGMNNSNVVVSFNNSFLENENHPSLNSILNTQRKISKLTISLGNFGRDYEDKYGYAFLARSAIPDAIKIVTKFSATIKCFHLEHCTLGMCDFLQILSLLPNVEHLKFSYVKEKVPMHQFSDERLNLHRVKTLSLDHCCKEFLVVFNRLPANVLSGLHIEHWNLDSRYLHLYPLLARLFEQQSKITKLALIDGRNREIRVWGNIFDHLKLKSLVLPQCSDYATILSKQPELTSLSLCEAEADGTVLNVITSQLTKLELLDIAVNSAIDQFKKIVNLKKLKDLSLESCSLNLIETLAGLDNSRITNLKMTHVYTAEIDDYGTLDDDALLISVIGALANSLPNLKELFIDYLKEYETIGAIMKNFNYIEVLIMGFELCIEDAKSLAQAIHIDHCFNPKLTELRIYESFLFDEPILTKLIAMYPNLQTLLLDSIASITVPQLKIILNGFKAMKWLLLYVHEGSLTPEHLYCIKAYKNNLTSVTLDGLHHHSFTDYIEKMLSSVYDVVEFNCGTLHLGYNPT